MAQKLRFERNSEGVRALLRSEQMQDALNKIATGIEQRAGSDGYDKNVIVGRNRASGRVFTTNKESFNDNLDNNTLLRGLK